MFFFLAECVQEHIYCVWRKTFPKTFFWASNIISLFKRGKYATKQTNSKEDKTDVGLRNKKKNNMSLNSGSFNS